MGFQNQSKLSKPVKVCRSEARFRFLNHPEQRVPDC